jgi:hypothetical protein
MAIIHPSPSRWRRSNQFLLLLIGLVVAGLAGLDGDERRAD